VASSNPETIGAILAKSVSNSAQQGADLLHAAAGSDRGRGWAPSRADATLLQPMRSKLRMGSRAAVLKSITAPNG
jgi:hypothetical protein